jgi:phosphonopyruvate decarboxylase
VYLQNSGYGNLVNPVLSMADPEVYGIPMLVIVGWRGQPGIGDEPQHNKQGRLMPALLDAMELPWSVLPKETSTARRCVEDAIGIAVERSCPSFLLVEKNTFTPEPALAAHPDLPSREAALTGLIEAIGDEAVVVSTTGMLSRELWEVRTRAGASHDLDFLVVGAMGHASSIALGIAMAEPDREVWCLDGDGALLMHLGSLAVVADHAPATYFHVVFNNGVHDSVGGQPTSIGRVDVPAAARAMGYPYAESTSNMAALPDAVAALRASGGPSLLDLHVRPGGRADLGRPTRSPRESTTAFRAAVRA